MNPRNTLPLFIVGGLMMLALGCGKAKDAVNEVKIEGNWLMTESDNAGVLVKAIEKDSMVLSFKSGKAAFSPTNSLKGRTLVHMLSDCVIGPRPYKIDNGQLVLEAVAGCAQKRAKIVQLDSERLKFVDPENAKITRSFVKIDDARFNALVVPADRKL